MEKLNTEAGTTATTITLVGGALTGIIGMLKAGHFLDPLITGFGKLAGILKMTPKGLGAWGIGIGALIGVLDLLTTSYAEATAEAERLNAELAADYGAGSRYDELISRQSELNGLEREELELLEQQMHLKEEMAKQAEKEAFEKWQEEEGSGAQHGFSIVTKDIAQYDTFQKSLESMLHDFAFGKTNINEFNDAFVTLLGSQEDYIEQVQKGIDQGYDVSEWQEKHLELYNEILKIYSNENLTAIEKFGLAYYESLKASGKGVEEAERAANEAMANIWEQQEKAIEKDKEATESADTVVTTEYEDNSEEAIAQANEVKAAADAVGGERTISYTVSIGKAISKTIGNLLGIGEFASGTSDAPGGPALVNELGPEIISADGQAYIAGGGKPTVANLPEGAIVLNAQETKQAMRGGKLELVGQAFAGGITPSYPMWQAKQEDGNKHWTFKDANTGKTHYYKQPIYEIPIKSPSSPTISGILSGDDSLHGPHGLSKEQLQAMGSYTAGLLTGELGKGGPYGSGPQYTGNPYGSGGGGGGGGGSGPSLEEIVKSQTQAFKDQLDLLKDRLEIMEKEGKSEEARIDQIKKIQAEIERQKQWYYDHGEDENSKYIRDLEKQWLDYADEIKSLYKEQAGIYDKLFGAVADKAGDEIEALEKQKEAIQKQNDETQKQIELEKALDDLARARQQKKLVFKDGRMQYVTDVDAVSKAQQRIEEIKNRETMDKQIADIDKKIAEWQAYQDQWSAIGGDYEKAQDLAIIAKKLGIDLNKENWTEQLKDVQTYIDKYNDLMVKGGAENVALKARAVPITGGNAGGAVAPANLWSMGVPTPASMMSSAVSGLSNLAKSTSITIQNFNPNLPGVSDGEGFVKYLRNNFLQQTLQFANG